MEMMARHRAAVAVRRPSMKVVMTKAVYKSGAGMGDLGWRGMGRWIMTIGGDGVVARLDEVACGVRGQNFLSGLAGGFLVFVCMHEWALFPASMVNMHEIGRASCRERVS